MKPNEIITDSSTETSTVTTWLEPDDIHILPQYRLKARQTDRVPAICYYNGTFVPIHAGHINVLEATKNYINGLGTHELLGAYISPSHLGYVAKKLSPAHQIGAGHRLSMIRLAIEDMDWVMIDLFEMFQPTSTSVRILMEHFISRVRSQLPDGARMDIFWLKGEDALFHPKSSDSILQYGFHTVYIVNRDSDEKKVDQHDKANESQNECEKLWQNLRALSAYPEKFHLVRAPHMNLSSGKIRRIALDRSKSREQLHSSVQIDKVTTYILEHRLWSTRPVKMLTLAAFPNDMSDLTPEFLSSMLSTDTNNSVTVNSFKSEQIGVGIGWSGCCHRIYDIEYASDSKIENLPSSMVLKLSMGIWLERVAAMEAEFYTKLGPLVSNIDIPKCYYAACHSESSNRSLLLLEDLSINYQPLGKRSSLQNSTVSQLVASIACVHAEFFNHPLFKDEMFSWLPSLNSTLTHYTNQYAVKMADTEYTKLLESNVSQKAFTYAKMLVCHLPHVFQALTEEFYTLCHGDFWINNVFSRRTQSNRYVLFDWQACCCANGLTDVVFLLRLLEIDKARSLESEALELYHNTLVKYGVKHYDLSDICNDYYSLALPFMFVLLSSLTSLKTSKFERTMAMLEDIVNYGKNSRRLTCNCLQNI